MKKGFFAGLTVTMLILATLVGCYQAPKPASAPTLTPAKPGEVAVTASYPRFKPSAISLTKGSVVQLKISATDMKHTFTIDELGINISVPKGQTITKEIKLEKTGSFAFYCAVPGHRSAGMQGTLKVTE